MTNLLQRLAKSRAALAGWRVAAALLCFAPGAALAAERQLDFRGQKIVVNGLNEGDWEYVGEPNS